MSILDAPPHEVEIGLVTATPDRYGKLSYRLTGETLRVACSVQPVSAQEQADLGLSVETRKRIICRSWPGSLHEPVFYDGRRFEQTGEATEYRMSPRTAHVDVLITAVDPEVK